MFYDTCNILNHGLTVDQYDDLCWEWTEIKIHPYLKLLIVQNGKIPLCISELSQNSSIYDFHNESGWEFGSKGYHNIILWSIKEKLLYRFT